jgi:hypothetical protein
MKTHMYVQLDKEKPSIGNISGLSLAAVKHTTVRVSNCHFGGLNKLRHGLPAVPTVLASCRLQDSASAASVQQSQENGNTTVYNGVKQRIQE